MAHTGGHSPIKITCYLGGIDFPANKQNLIDHARANKADEQVLDILNRMPDKEFWSMADVTKSMGRLE